MESGRGDLNRRKILLGSAGLIAGELLLSTQESGVVSQVVHAAQALKSEKNAKYSTDEKLTPLKDVTTYNNFYEFGTSKEDPAQKSGGFQSSPWSVQFDGEVEKSSVMNFEDILKGQVLEERIYRFRCVEGWSMVIPWVGFPLHALLKKMKIKSNAKFVEFTTLLDPKRFPGQARAVLDWPYVEGLRMDEAMHPLTFVAVGLYGEVLLPQNGAPLRLVIPWKYGFKSIKSIVRMRMVEKQPESSWMKSAPSEYGFYSNVNPSVDHPRWSQARERRIGEILKRKTLPFNGYADEVASLYSGMDLKKNF
jgi:sulfoxide reductase catalytic subunit YedY